MTQKPRAIRATEFVDALKRSGMKSRGWDIFATYTHAYLETGNFQCPLTEHAYNTFGIKGAYKGKFMKVDTFEVVDGKNEPGKYDFRVYPNFDGLLKDYQEKIGTTYHRSYASKGNYKDFFNGLLNWKGKELIYPSWSTSPEYSTKLISLYERLQKQGDLYQLIRE